MTKYIVGVDEAGCGALAGPLVVAAAAFAADAGRVSATWQGTRGDKTLLAGDSKGIKDPSQRLALARAIRSCAIAYTIIEKTSQEIDQRLFGTVFPEAVRLAAARCVEQLFTLEEGLQPSDVLVLIDGDIQRPQLPCPTHCIPDGDKTDWRIGAASILAKARHDECIEQLVQAYPTWEFDAHRGYGTKKHKDLLTKRGPTPDHRKSFRPVRETMPRAKGIEE